MNPKEYYSRKDVQKELTRISKNREVQAWFGKDIAGKRPEVVNYEGDIKDLVKQGMTSFHISEERWENPLELEPGMLKKDLDKLRIGWDLLLDLDSKNLEFSKYAAELLIEALKFHDIKTYSLKYSGNNGFHIAIPFEAFPSEINGVNIKDYFPDGVRVISGYLKEMIQPFLIEKILKYGNMEKIATSAGKRVDDIIINKKFDPFKVVDIDSVLISNRHLFRAPYSINEKSGLVSIPLKEVSDLDLEKAKPENVETKIKFLDFEDVNHSEGRQLLIQAFDWIKKSDPIAAQKINRQTFDIPKVAIKSDFFPQCMLKLMNGVKEDGRKRGIFVLINFLANVGWNYDVIQDFLIKWNEKNYEPLREGYIKAQISWARRQTKKVLPPNCSNPNYYKNMGIKCEDNICFACKNPVNYVMKRLRISENQKKQRSKV